jgi:hypothetical protein
VTELIDPGVAFLERLLSLSERSPERIRPASATPDYDSFPRADAIARFRDQLAAAERSGAIVLRYGKRERKHLVERVIVQDPIVLARHLGRAPASVQANNARKSLEPAIASGEPWLAEVLDEMQNRWARGEQAYRLGSGHLNGAREFLMLLCSISKGEARGLDARTFALRATGDTKAFDRQSSRLLAVLSQQFGETSADTIWSRIGLDRYPHPVHLHGPVLVQDAEGLLVDGRAKPFASIHPEMFPYMKLASTPAYVLTIENYASFNRHARELDDGGLVVYTGGFASAAVIALMTLILNGVGDAVPFLHWGDIDPGGLRIFRYLEESLPRAPRPHLMQRTLAESRGRTASPDPSLDPVARSCSGIADLAQWLAWGQDVRHLEQEAVDPISPAAVNDGRDT